MYIEPRLNDRALLCTTFVSSDMRGRFGAVTISRVYERNDRLSSDSWSFLQQRCASLAKT